jgi:hypothetical protein
MKLTRQSFLARLCKVRLYRAIRHKDYLQSS